VDAPIWQKISRADGIKRSILSPLQFWPLPVVNMGRQRQHHSDRQSQTVSLTPGAGKEWYDSRPNGSGWSWKDFAWDAAGAASGIALWNLSQ